ncbi:hypothetical protein LS70_003965 [Helicobacter sp. MIT 11-5569]|uniref:hypothetical protein n=1 Tax=Helicobacter sp. MIT 11-5569 TaxID=1548151 RepID=UPI00068A6EAA|nr:hypothetical protein [Helicobacter sp. MIT 11-5569]TLD83972.1 hypothetical protein LS70_003965 [Helicobacter sp. MIT 11-5569]
MKKVFLSLVVMVNFAFAQQCTVLDFSLKTTDVRGIFEKYKFVEKQLGGFAVPRLEPKQFKVKELKEIELGWDDDYLLEYVTLHFNSWYFEEIKKTLDEKYVLKRKDVLKETYVFKKDRYRYGYFYYMTKDKRDCEIHLSYDKNSDLLTIDYIWVQKSFTDLEKML